jgi:hypothetical protein
MQKAFLCNIATISSGESGGWLGSIFGHKLVFFATVSKFFRVSRGWATYTFGNGLIVIVKLYTTVWTWSSIVKLINWSTGYYSSPGP